MHCEPSRRPHGQAALSQVATLELDASGVSDLGPSGVTTHVNKVHHVTTINRVAEQLGEDEDWLREVASEMEIEDGVIWVYGVGEDGVLAFTWADRGCDGDFDAELVRPMSLALADAFDFRRVQGIDFRAALTFLLLADAPRPH